MSQRNETMINYIEKNQYAFTIPVNIDVTQGKTYIKYKDTNNIVVVKHKYNCRKK